MNDYLEYVLEQLSGLGPLRSRKMFGGIGLYAGDVFFALIAYDVLYLKVDDTNRSDYEAHQSQPFEYKPGHVMSYWELPVSVLEKPAEAVAWARRSVEVSRSARKPKKGSPRKPKAAHKVKLRSLRNLGPKSAKWLAEVGLETRADLEQVGSVAAYRKVRASGSQVSLNLLYALEGALLDVHWNELPAPLKAKLREAAEA